MRAPLAALCGAWALALGMAAAAGPDAGPASADLEQGAYLARIGGCAACHTAPQGGKPFAGGRPVPSPFGSIHSSNITPHPEHGIGRYTLQDFRRALREGTARGGKHLYPAMPYTAYAKMTDEDLRALYDYLQKAVAPVAMPTPPNRLPFPFNQRGGLFWWKLAFLPEGVHTPRKDRSAAWNRGAYLVQAVSHCGACHTARGLAYQERGYDERSPKFLTGQVNDHWYAADLTNDTGAGMARLGVDALAALLRTGHGGGSVAFGSMVEEIEGALQYLRPADAQAIAVYLASLPAPEDGPVGSPATIGASPSLAAGAAPGDGLEPTGAAVYRSFCAGCHGAQGEGAPPRIPRLAGNPSVLAKDSSALARLIVEGGRGAVTRDGPVPAVMPGFGGTLTDVQMAQVLSFVRRSWGNGAKAVTTADVSRLRRKTGR